MRKWIVGSLFLLAPAFAGAACGSSPKLAEYRSTPPLLAAEPDTAYLVTVRADGCVSVRYPKQDTRAGSYQRQLAADQLNRLLGEFRASGVAAIDPRELRMTLNERAKAKAADAQATLYAVSDENIVEFEWAAAAKSGPAGQLRWATLQQDLLNHPEHPDLASINALADLFDELGDSVRSGEEIAQ